jgi:hypothetical protein
MATSPKRLLGDGDIIGENQSVDESEFGGYDCPISLGIDDGNRAF